MIKIQLLCLGIIVIILSGCASSEMYDKQFRTNKLRKIYPPGKTSQEYIHKKMQSKPNLFEKRPPQGWEYHRSVYLEQKIQKLEKKIGKKILCVERYMLPDSRSSFDFLSLCNIWFYYDAGNKVVDVEWEYKSD